MYCHKCGTEIVDNATFCINCGEKMSPTIDDLIVKKVEELDLSVDNNYVNDALIEEKAKWSSDVNPQHSENISNNAILIREFNVNGWTPQKESTANKQEKVEKKTTETKNGAYKILIQYEKRGDIEYYWLEDKNGKRISENYHYISSVFCKGLVVIKCNEKYGYLGLDRNIESGIKVSCILDFASDFNKSNQYADCVLEGKKCRVSDTGILEMYKKPTYGVLIIAILLGIGSLFILVKTSLGYYISYFLTLLFGGDISDSDGIIVSSIVAIGIFIWIMAAHFESGGYKELSQDTYK